MIEERRGPLRDDDSGRRAGDARAWFEGTVKQALELGWHVDEDGRHICRRCVERGLRLR